MWEHVIQKIWDEGNDKNNISNSAVINPIDKETGLITHRNP